MKALVTGATGFVGANLVRRLLQEGYEVHLLLRQGYTPWRLQDLEREVSLHLADLGSREQVSALFQTVRPDVVYHLAVYGAYSSQQNIDRMIATNITGTVILLEAAARFNCGVFVNTGSSSEYGFKDHAPAEDEWLEPNSGYAITKAAATHFTQFFARQFGLYAPTLRLYSIYGPYEEPTRLIPTLLMRGLAGELPPLVDPAIARDYVYVDDAVEAYLLAASHPGGDRSPVYNVGSGIQTSLATVVDTVIDLLAIPARPVWGSMPNRSWDTEVWCARNDKITASLGWQPRHDLREGLLHTIEWLQSEPQREHYQRALGMG